MQVRRHGDCGPQTTSSSSQTLATPGEVHTEDSISSARPIPLNLLKTGTRFVFSGARGPGTRRAPKREVAEEVDGHHRLPLSCKKGPPCLRGRFRRGTHNCPALNRTESLGGGKCLKRTERSVNSAMGAPAFCHPAQCVVDRVWRVTGFVQFLNRRRH